MFTIFFLLFLALAASLFLVPFKTGRRAFWARTFRVFVVVLSIGAFTYFFVTKSLSQFRKDALSIQLINKLPLPLDFYFIQLETDESKNLTYETRHVGNIRSNHYRLEYLDVQNSDEVWIAGFLGKKNMVYFSQHSLVSKNEDRKIEVNNYLNQSAKLSEIAKIQIEELKAENRSTAIWIVLDFLLLFLNLYLLFTLKSRKIPI